MKKMAESKKGNGGDMLQSVTKHLYVENDFNDALGKVADKIGVKREYLVAGWITIMGLSLLSGYCVQLLSTVAAIFYPCYITLQKLDSSTKDDKVQWSMYWVIFADIVLLETWVEYILPVFPFYYLFKIVFLGWCSCPSPKNGSTMIYNKVVCPFILKKNSGELKAK